jgi:hypothetical protein
VATMRSVQPVPEPPGAVLLVDRGDADRADRRPVQVDGKDVTVCPVHGHRADPGFGLNEVGPVAQTSHVGVGERVQHGHGISGSERRRLAGT